MGSDWKQTTIGQLCDAGIAELQTGPFGSQLHAYDYVDDGVPVVPTEAIRDRQIDHSVLPEIPASKARELARHRLVANDILFARRGVQATGHIGYVRAAEDGFICGTGAIRLRLATDQDEADPDFLSQVLANSESIAWFKFHAIGATMPNLNEAIIRSFPLAIPPLAEQQAIAHILGALDDKIELNRRMNETLEAFERRLFRSWFVDFDPVRANAEGHDSGLPQQIADVFPKAFQGSELGEIPEGWRVTSLGELSRRVAMGPFGSNIKTDNFIEFGVPVVRGSNLADGFVDDNFVFLTEAKADQLRNANAFPDDVVITHRGTLGQVGLIPVHSRFPRYVVSQSQMLISADKDAATPRYIYEFLRCPVGQQALLANTSQTGVPAIARPTTSLRSIRLVVPPLEVMEHFGRAVDPISRRQNHGIEERRTLAGLRDALLPKLISGEIRLNYAERAEAMA